MVYCKDENIFFDKRDNAKIQSKSNFRGINFKEFSLPGVLGIWMLLNLASTGKFFPLMDSFL